jgi:hypothetical protein
MMKIWHGTAERTLALGEELPALSRKLDKKLLTLDGRYPFATQPAPIGAVYVVGRYDPDVEGRSDIQLQVFSRSQGLKVLLEFALNRAYLLPAENASLLALFPRLTAQASIGVLRYPDGFDRQQAVYDQVYARVLEDLGRS